MKPIFIFCASALIASALAAVPAAADQTWVVDPGHSEADFTVRHLIITKVKGFIKVQSASLITPVGGTLPSAVDATLDASSINTQNPDRDTDLRGPDWLDVGKYPTITFRSSSVVPGDNGDFQLIGDLTIHGVTKPVTLKSHYEGQIVDGRGNKRISYTASVQIDRRDFGLLWAHATPGGSLIADNLVDIDLSIEAIAK